MGYTLDNTRRESRPSQLHLKYHELPGVVIHMLHFSIAVLLLGASLLFLFFNWFIMFLNCNASTTGLAFYSTYAALASAGLFAAASYIIDCYMWPSRRVLIANRVFACISATSLLAAACLASTVYALQQHMAIIVVCNLLFYLPSWFYAVILPYQYTYRARLWLPRYFEDYEESDGYTDAHIATLSTKEQMRIALHRQSLCTDHRPPYDFAN